MFVLKGCLTRVRHDAFFSLRRRTDIYPGSGEKSNSEFCPFTVARTNQKLPVVMFIHGGGYDWGSGNAYEGTLISSYANVVFVTINFRLGILGEWSFVHSLSDICFEIHKVGERRGGGFNFKIFYPDATAGRHGGEQTLRRRRDGVQTLEKNRNFSLSHDTGFFPAMEHASRANNGLLDQVAALHWIHRNIEAFGGDPDDVTIFGHGTGAACVNFLMMYPMAKGKRHRRPLTNEFFVGSDSFDECRQFLTGFRGTDRAELPS